MNPPTAAIKQERRMIEVILPLYCPPSPFIGNPDSPFIGNPEAMAISSKFPKKQKLSSDVDMQSKKNPRKSYSYYLGYTVQYDLTNFIDNKILQHDRTY